MPQKCETISYYSPTPYREPRKRASNLQTVWRFTTMHLKPYPKAQDKALHQERGQDGTHNLHVDQQGVLRTEWGVRQACSFIGSPGNGTANRCPLRIISTNTFRCATNCSSPPSRTSGNLFGSWTCKSKAPSSVSALNSSLVLLSSPGLENEGSLRIYQEEDSEGYLDIWAVIKPGNTKEKIAIFTSQKCSHVGTDGSNDAPEREGTLSNIRMVSMKSKGSWDGDWSMAKRRKRSVIPDKPTGIEDPEQKPEIYTAPNTTNENLDPCFGIAEEITKTDGEEGGKNLSVVEMVAYLEQRANNQRVNLKPVSLRNSNTVGLSKSISVVQTEDQVSKGPQLPEGHEEEKSVRVLDMVAKLESQCLSRQSLQEGGDLSRNNSLRRRVGRVLLAGSEPCSMPSQSALASLPQDEQVECVSEEVAVGVVSCSCESPVLKGCSEFFVNHNRVEQESRNVSEHETCADTETIKDLLSLTSEVPSEAKSCYEDPLPGMLFFAQFPPQALQEQKPLSISENIPIGQSMELYFNEQQSVQRPKPALDSITTMESFRGENVVNLGADQDLCKNVRDGVGAISRDPVPLHRLVSHEFLETRFKIQLLLEPQQYMAFLPHHIIVKIFSLLPTESLAALKCTCHYFKFIIESYGVRPADSRWVSDPRYKDDPCKQCKKRYGRGDVSLCRWHHKPYCQALPYGPGYWMCCRGSHRDTPGCNVGLHDNHWVPAFHSINMPIYKKSRDGEEDV